MWQIFQNIPDCFGSFRNSSVCFGCFDMCRFETPKQTENLFFWFHETNRNKRETDLVSVRTEIFFSFRGHPSSCAQQAVWCSKWDIYNSNTFPAQWSAWTVLDSPLMKAYWNHHSMGNQIFTHKRWVKVLFIFLVVTAYVLNIVKSWNLPLGQNHQQHLHLVGGK